MKKILFLFLTFFVFQIDALAANPLLQCDYNAKTTFPTNDQPVYQYIKYRFIYYDDNTIKKYIALNGKSDLVESNVGLHVNVTAFSSDNKDNGMFSTVGDNFSADNIKTYAEKKVCPKIAFNYQNFDITPVEDDSLHGTAYTTVVSDGSKKTFDSSTGEENTPKDPQRNPPDCAFHFEKDKIPSVDAFTVEFIIYDNGAKYFKAYLTEQGDGMAQENRVTEEGVTATLTNNKGRTYHLNIPAEEIPNIYKQNFSQVNHSTFTCPSSGDKLYFIEDSFSEGYYHITTNAEEAEESNSTNFEEGVGDKQGDVSIDIDIPFDISGGCDSYLGNPADYVNKPPAYYLQFVFNLMKYIAIIILFVMTVIEFVKATASNNQDALKKALQNTVKRLIIAIIIFFLPYLIKFLLTLAGAYSPSTCGIS